jgi:hypothetical protein
MDILDTFREPTKNGLYRSTFEINSGDCIIHPRFGTFSLNKQNPQKIVIPQIQTILKEYGYKYEKDKDDKSIIDDLFIKYHNFIRIKNKRVIYRWVYDDKSWIKLFESFNLKWFECYFIPLNLDSKIYEKIRIWKVQQLERMMNFYATFRNDSFHNGAPLTTSDSYKVYMKECKEYGVVPYWEKIRTDYDKYLKEHYANVENTTLLNRLR